MMMMMCGLKWPQIKVCVTYFQYHNVIAWLICCALHSSTIRSDIIPHAAVDQSADVHADGCAYHKFISAIAYSTGFLCETEHWFSLTEHHDSTRISLHSNRTLKEEVTSMQETVQKHAAHSKDDSSHSRKKRFLSYPRFVELMVTADVKMVRHHGRNLEHYILTIMSVVSEVLLSLSLSLSYV